MEEFEFILRDTIAKAKSVIPKHTRIKVAYSGGADSDTMMFLLREIGFGDIGGVFYDTGIEWEATKRHIDYMRSLGFDVETIRAVRPVPTSNKKYGHPFINKRVSDYLQRLQRHNFDFQNHGNLTFDELYKIYPRCKTALKWWCNEWGKGSAFNIDRNAKLKEFLIEFGLPFRVSNKCCEGAKKLPIKKYAEKNNIDLILLGIRYMEGRARAGTYNRCYMPKEQTYSMYLPLFYWSDAMKTWYDETRAIVHSDCYTKYGLTRTGCAGCPFGLNLETELTQLNTHEPKLAKGIENIFAPTYEWTRKYRAYKNS